MNLERRILQSLRPRREGVLLRSDVNHFGSASQVSVALKSLLGKGLISLIEVFLPNQKNYFSAVQPHYKSKPKLKNKSKEPLLAGE